MRVLIIRPGALGDTLMLLPALKDLEGKAHVTFVGRYPGLDYIEPHVGRVMDMEGSGWHRLFMDPAGSADLPVSDADIAVAFLRDEGGAIRQNLQSAFPYGMVHLFPSVPIHEEEVHVAEHLALCLASAGLPVDPSRSLAMAREKGLCIEQGPWKREKTVVFHPGSGSREKNHPLAFWIDLIRRLRGDARFQDLKRVILLGPAEESLYTPFRDAFPRGDTEIRISRGRDLLLKTLDPAALYLGHDSGVTHLAALSGVPTVALFKENNVREWGPLGPCVRVVTAREPGPILLEQVFEAAGSVIRPSPSGRNRGKGLGPEG
jgi:heptosyltransferase III